jgi:hypothetical protein
MTFVCQDHPIPVKIIVYNMKDSGRFLLNFVLGDLRQDLKLGTRRKITTFKQGTAYIRSPGFRTSVVVVCLALPQDSSYINAFKKKKKKKKKKIYN